MRIRSVMGSLAVSAALFAGPVLAVEAQRVEKDLNFDERHTKVGLDVRLGLGGVTGALGDETGTGPLLGISAGAQPWKALGVEVGYEGQRLPLTEDFVPNGEALYRHNLGLLAKVGPMMNDKWRPYVGAGVGLSYLNVSDGAEPFYDNDIIEEVPLAAGLDYNFGGAIFAGARATYRLMYGEGYADDIAGSADGSLFNASLTLGGRF
jgi:opacity protein-like surface antigen